MTTDCKKTLIFARIELAHPSPRGRGHVAGISTFNIDTMDQGLVYEICGWAASIGMILGYLPQAIETIRTRNTDGIALPTFLMMAVGGLCFMLQGILHKPDVLWALFLTNLVTTSCSIIVFSIKVYNDYIKKKK